jgi:leucyl-tRNA synthetase
VKVPAGATEVEHEAAARADERVAAHLDGVDVLKVIVVPGRLVNFVTR